MFVNTSYCSRPMRRLCLSIITAITCSASAESVDIDTRLLWDWVPGDQLCEQRRCNTGCKGDYIELTPDWPEADLPPEQAPLRASANASEMLGSQISLQGDITVSQGNQQLKADSAALDRNTNQLVLTDNVTVRQPQLLIRADSANVNTETREGAFENARFVKHDSRTRGSATRIERNSPTTLVLEQGSLTQCAPNDETWRLQANRIHLDTEEGWGRARNAQLRIKNVPVFYTPYLSFPIDDRRKTGFLWPTFTRSSRSGAEISLPYYINIAPNYDATIAPRFIEKRGTMLETELRHLNRYGEWLLSGAYLQDDQFIENPTAEQLEDTPTQEKRWLAGLEHSGKVLGLNTRIDYTKVGENDFFDDLSTDSLELQRVVHLNQSVSIGYLDANWDIELLAQDYQTIGDNLDKQYQFLPRLSVAYSNAGVNFAPQWLLNAEFTDFDHDQSLASGGRFITGQRSFGEAGISYPMRWAPGFIVPTVKARSVSYRLDDVTAGDDDSPSASTTLGNLDMGLIFERQTEGGLLQTLEPRLYYFYSDFDDQGSLPNFDSRALNFSVSQLYRDTRFGGRDRLDDANQVSLGLTSRFISSDSGREWLTLSAGQIFYLQDRRIALNPNAPADTLSNSSIATELQYQPADRHWLSSSLLWDSRADKIDEGGVAWHYQSAANNLYNLGYRYRRSGGNRGATGINDLSQVDASALLSVNENWSLYARLRYDVEEKHSIDDLVGLQYEGCCWMIRLLYQQNLKEQAFNVVDQRLEVERDYGLVIEFQLKGLGSLGNRATKLLEESILGYEDLN